LCHFFSDIIGGKNNPQKKKYIGGEKNKVPIGALGKRYDSQLTMTG